MVVEVIAQLQVATILLETHARTVVVCATILGRHRAAELPAAYLVGCFGLEGAITARAKVDVCADAIFTSLTGHDVHHTSHRIASVKYRCRASQHLDALSHQCLITVGNGVTVDALILWMTVNENEQLTCTARDTTQIDTASGTR